MLSFMGSVLQVLVDREKTEQTRVIHLGPVVGCSHGAESQACLVTDDTFSPGMVPSRISGCPNWAFSPA